ncbi:molybdate ABC transporter substrate-binding protein [Janibacter alkaliphilus]|uniref:Molybdate transport system substrate-binding protein n=1 Tax=Janibacter alkaliphilus TaxID=1069963 RepID=A0A852X0Y1_9MICO|nr:molybdate transport system substrate-binding protein [Janibacter alkaliphilus]
MSRTAAAHRRRAAVAVAGLALTAAAAGCADDETTLTVLAAASLREPMEQLAADLEAEHDGVEVRLSFAGSSELASQVLQGAPADVLVTADEPTMARVADAGLADGAPELVATNRMTIATPPGNPSEVESVDDLGEDHGGDLDLVVCAPQVPCGAAAQRVAETAGVTLAPVSEESKVTDVVAKVAAGEADAGIVYVTDTAGRDDLDAVEIPDRLNTTTAYPAAALTGSAHPELAREMTDLVVADGAGEGRGRLAAAGFEAP